MRLWTQLLPGFVGRTVGPWAQSRNASAVDPRSGSTMKDRRPVGSLALVLAVLIGLLLGIQLSVVTARAEGEDTKVLLLLDVSGSMNEKISSGGTKFAAAKKALKQVADSMPAGTQVGLRVYGSKIAEPQAQNPKACQDSDLVMPIGPLDTKKMYAAVDSFKAVGETPIAYSLEQSVKDLGDSGKRVLVLISDGEENCKPDPCPTAKKLADSGVDLQFNAVGLDVGAKARKQLQCIADAGDGSYYDANRADELSESIRKITQRALRPFAVSGTPVKGTIDPADAPSLPAGQYTDTYSTDGRTRHYRIERTPGSRVTVSLTSLVTQYGGFNQEFWDVELTAESGTRCDSASLSRVSFNGSTLVTAVVRSVRSAGGSSSTAADPCDTEPLLVAIGRSAAKTKAPAVPIELRVDEEPPITNLDELPGPLEDYSGEAKALSSAKAQATLGGTSFSNAPTLAAGSWTDTIAAGETLVYRVPIATGQRLRATARFPLKGSDWSLTGATTVTPELRLFTADRSEVSSVNAVLMFDRSAALTRATPEVRSRNRQATGQGSDRVRAAATAGDHFVVVSLEPGSPDLNGRLMQIQVDVAIDGRMTGQPTYDRVAKESVTPASSLSPQSSSDSPSPNSATTLAPDQPGERVAGLAGAPLVVGGGVALLVGACAVGWRLRRRRRSHY